MAAWFDIVINFEKQPGIFATSYLRPQACIASIPAATALAKVRQYLNPAM